MKILLTGASGFVGSHILDSLREKGYPVAVLLRSTSSSQLIAHHLPGVEVRQGSISDEASLEKAMQGITHVVHCAGATRANSEEGYFSVNHGGTRNVVNVVNAHSGTVKRLVHISSLAVSGPSTADSPATESGPRAPISQYGRSKLAAEQEVCNNCKVPWVVLRPPAVYGPRDNGFLSLFKAVERHVLPKPSAQQELSVVYVKDLAKAVALAIDHPQAVGKIFFVASHEVVTPRAMADEIGRQAGRWTVPCPLPPAAFLPVCAVNELVSRFTGRATLLNMQKFAELRAPGWVCSPARLKAELAYTCSTTLQEGIGETLRWYREQRWV